MKAYIFNYHKIHDLNLLALQTSFKHIGNNTMTNYKVINSLTIGNLSHECVIGIEIKI